MKTFKQLEREIKSPLYKTREQAMQENREKRGFHMEYRLQGRLVSEYEFKTKGASK